MFALGERLRAARIGRGMSQEEFARLACVSRRAQVNYESDERTPETGYLAALLANGIDVPYILTGIRSDPDALQNWVLAARTTAEAIGFTDEDRASLMNTLIAGAAEPRVNEPEHAYAAPRDLRCDQLALLDAYERCAPGARKAAIELLASAAQSQLDTPAPTARKRSRGAGSTGDQ
jgi:transcriptional regulator with XRE-family HTH domain